MSKLFGKNLLKTKFEGEKYKIAKFGLEVKYLKTRDIFQFFGYRPNMERLENALGDGLTFEDLGEKKNVKYFLEVPRKVLEAMIKADSVDSVVYSWSIGYRTKRKLGSGLGVYEEMKTLCDRERAYIVSLCGDDANHLLSYEDYEDLSMWQYVYCISLGFVKDAMKQWKRVKWKRVCACDIWIPLKLRQESPGRKVGSVNKYKSVSEKDLENEPENVSDVFERADHNMRVAVMKGIFGWYLEAYKEKCKILGMEFNKDVCLSMWKDERGE